SEHPSFPTRRSSDLAGPLRRGGDKLPRANPREGAAAGGDGASGAGVADAIRLIIQRIEQRLQGRRERRQAEVVWADRIRNPSTRSEEHTSELQSRSD